jgi:hypothetical protein
MGSLGVGGISPVSHWHGRGQPRHLVLVPCPQVDIVFVLAAVLGVQ